MSAENPFDNNVIRSGGMLIDEVAYTVVKDPARSVLSDVEVGTGVNYDPNQNLIKSGNLRIDPVTQTVTVIR